MKIATIWKSYGPYHLARVRALQQVFSGADFVCMSHCAEDDLYEFFNLKPPGHKVLIPRNSNSLRFFESFVAALRALHSEHPNLILTCGYERPETLASVIWAHLARGVVFLMLDNQYEDRRRNWLVEFAKRIYLLWFNGFLYSGDTHRDYLEKMKVPERLGMSGYDCVDNAAIWRGAEAARNGRLPLFASNPYFLCVARMIKKKNLTRLIYAYAAYVERISQGREPWSLVICGDGPERGHVEDAIRDCHLDGGVALPGSVNDFDRIINYYAFARALVLASNENEQWGLVVNEAMASGLPVIVSRQCGCSRNLVRDGVNGFTFEGNSIEQLSARLLWMHEHEGLLPEMGRRSREIVDGYSPKNFAVKVLHLYTLNRKGCCPGRSIERSASPQSAPGPSGSGAH